MPADTPSLDEIFWDRHDNRIVDALLFGQPRIEVSARPARNRNGATAELTIGYGVGPNLVEQYGSNQRAAMILVAVDLDRGTLFANAPIDPHSVPLAAILSGSPSRLPETSDGELVMAGLFGLDFARTLSLPARGARYAVFVWLDGIVSNTVAIDFAQSPPRDGREATPLDGLPTSLQLRTLGSPDGRGPALVDGKAGPELVATAFGPGPAAVLVLDGGTRLVTGGSVLVESPAILGASLADFVAQRAKTRYPSWAVVFDGRIAQKPVRIPPAQN